MTCEKCNNNPATITAIIAGTYYKDLCVPCKHELESGQRISSGAAGWNRTIDAEDNEAAVQQPYSEGRPNPKFIAAYPSKAAELFSTEELRNANR